MSNEEYTDEDLLEWIDDRRNYDIVLSICSEILHTVEPLAQQIRETQTEGLSYDPKLQYFVESRTHSMVNDMLYADDGQDYMSDMIHGLEDDIKRRAKKNDQLWVESAKKLVT